MEKIFRDKNGHYYIQAVYEGDYVIWSMQELDYLQESEYSTIQEFESMIQSEKWSTELN